MFNNDVKKLTTPLCEFSIVDDNGKSILFDIIPDNEGPCEVWLDSDPKRVIVTENYISCKIRISTNNLNLFSPYYLKTSQSLEYRDADEGLFTYGITSKDTTLSISFPERNEEVKYRQTESTELIKYDIEELNSHTFKIVLLDRSELYIYVAIAWIWGIQDHMDDYECAADVLTWTV